MLTRAEAARRRALIDVSAYDLDIDLTVGDQEFGVVTTISFTCDEPGETTFVEHRPGSIRSVSLNGKASSPPVPTDGRIGLEGLERANELIVESRVPYAASADGLCRSVDPADGEAYVFSMCFLDAAPRVFACFDQPDLKAPFTIRVRVPDGWVVRSNGEGQRVGSGDWRFAATPPMPPYLVAIVAGPWHVVEDRHGDLPLSLLCRRSATPFLEHAEVMTATKAGLTYFEELFATPYPYAKYDQVFIPLFGGGGMENAACTTLGEDLLFRSRPSESERSRRRELILHELSHMWFGDLVSVAWWDDLWMNESFATYMAFRAMNDALGMELAWPTFAIGASEGYPYDEMPSTHPIADPVATTDDALLNFDHISYVKGASVLNQLVAWIGDEAFREGIARYVSAHAHSTASSADFLAALQEGTDRDLDLWANEWLRSAAPNALRASVDIGADGTYRSVEIRQDASEAHPTLRRHAIAVGVYDEADDRLARRLQVPVEVDGSATPVPAIEGQPAASVILLDESNLTWAKRHLDARSLDRLTALGVSSIEEPRSRVAAWLSLREMVLDALVGVGRYVDVLVRDVPREVESIVLDMLLHHAEHAVDRLGDPARRNERRVAVSSACRDVLGSAHPGSDRQLVAARGFARLASSSGDLELLERWLHGAELPEGLALTGEDRWQVVITLAAHGRMREEEIADELADDRSSRALECAATAYAAMPSAAAKQRSWGVIFDPDRPRTERSAAARGFWRSFDDDGFRPYESDTVATVADAWRNERLATISWVAQDLLGWVPPGDDVLTSLREHLGRPNEPSTLRRVLAEAAWEIERARRARALDRNEVS